MGGSADTDIHLPLSFVGLLLYRRHSCLNLPAHVKPLLKEQAKTVNKPGVHTSPRKLRANAVRAVPATARAFTATRTRRERRDPARVLVLKQAQQVAGCYLLDAQCQSS